MNDDRLIRDLQALDRPIVVDPAFVDRLFGRLRDERRTRSRRLPWLLLAATLLLGAPVGAAVIGGGLDEDPPAVAPVRQTLILPSTDGPIQVEFAIPTDLDMEVFEGGMALAFAPTSSPVHDLDEDALTLPQGSRGVKVIDVAGATAHLSGGHPLGVDAASFMVGLRDHAVLDADLGPFVDARLGDTPALAADVLRTAPDAHLDKNGVIVGLWPSSRLIVADVGDAIVVVQIWAASTEELAAWRADAERLVASFRFVAGA